MTSHLRCPSCKLLLYVNSGVTPRHCPRCVARYARAVPLVPDAVVAPGDPGGGATASDAPLGPVDD